MSNQPEPTIKVLNGRKIGLWPSVSEAARQNGYTQQGLYLAIRKGAKSRKDGAKYMFAKDWIEPEPVQPRGDLYQSALSPRSRPTYESHTWHDTVGPEVTGLEGGLINTPAMLEFCFECREGLTLRIPAREQRLEFERKRWGKRLRITARLQLLACNTSMRDVEYIRDHRWEHLQVEDGGKLFFQRERLFSLEGIHA